MASSIEPKRILIVRPSALGDVCRTVPVLASLHLAFPEAEIDWVVRDTFVEAVSAHPALHEVIPFPRARFARWWMNPAAAVEMLRWFSRLRQRRYDLVLDCQGLSRSGLISWMTRATRRVGFRDAREFAWLGYNVRYSPGSNTHAVDRMLALLPPEGVEIIPDMRLYVADEPRQSWENMQRELEIDSRPYAVLGPTASRLSKRWPTENWGQLVRSLSRRGYRHLIVIGAPNELDQVRGIDAAAGSEATAIVNLTGQTSIGLTMAVIAQAGLVIANDSAPLHMAVGFDRPCIGLFGPTDPALVGPYLLPGAVVRKFEQGGGTSPNYRDRRLDDSLMRLISVEDVLERVDAVLAAGRDSGDRQAAAAGDFTPTREAKR